MIRGPLRKLGEPYTLHPDQQRNPSKKCMPEQAKARGPLPELEGTLTCETGTPAKIGGTPHASFLPAAKSLQKTHLAGDPCETCKEPIYIRRGVPGDPCQKWREPLHIKTESPGTPVKIGGNPPIPGLGNIILLEEKTEWVPGGLCARLRIPQGCV